MTEPTREQVQALAEAMWQLLDDMRTHGQCACMQAIAEARIAYEPFARTVDPDPEADADLMPLAFAERTVRELQEAYRR